MKQIYFTLIVLLQLFVTTLPSFSQRIENQQVQPTPYASTLIGDKNGLYQVSSTNQLVPVWQEGAVDKIMYADGWYFLTTKGVFFSNNLRDFEERNRGLPFSTIKNFDGETTSFTQQVHPLKDLEFLPGDTRTLVTTTKEEVFLSRNAGLSWQSLGYSSRTTGAKAVAVAMLPSEEGDETLTVFLSHPIYGVAYIQPDTTNPTWIDIPNGFEKMPTLDNPDEVADILVVSNKNSMGVAETEVYFTQSFLPRLYKLVWNEKKVELIASQKQAANTWDSLVSIDKELAFVSMQGIQFFSPLTNTFSTSNSADKLLTNFLGTLDTTPRSGWFPPARTGLSTAFGLNELWMTKTNTIEGTYIDSVSNKQSIYVPSGQVSSQAGINKYLAILEENNLNSIVIDMKDDKGILRYHTKDPFIAQKAFVSRYALDIEPFIEKFKAEDIYLIARIVVFKDANLYNYNNQEYAVWDKSTNASWQGEKAYLEDGSTTYYDEHWVDPYSHEVWEYNVAIAKELIALGFDEIQFDYIRFPTDGRNLHNAEYRWHEKGMDKESAILSFLSYARKNIDAPIGIDIYGVNGWYRSGLRTGQDVELIAPYVDVISPMSYPNHFESYFLAYSPAIERPYRIYFYGTYRNAVIARNQVLIRPWLQSFYLSNNSYDQQYYNADFVQRQVYGVRDATDTGYMYWNNGGRYDEVLPHIGGSEQSTLYPWEKAQRDITNTIPAFSGK